MCSDNDDDASDASSQGSVHSKQKKLISELRLSRGTVTMQQTKMKNYIETPNGAMSLSELDTRLGLLENYMARFNEIQARLEAEDPEEHKGDKRSSYEEIYISIKSKLLSLIQQKRPRASFPDVSYIAPARKNSNLPKIQIKRFSGNFSDWPDFYATFKTLVEENDELTDVEKLAYLRSSLEEGPFQVIGNIRLSDGGFSNALALLKSRFENKRLIFQSHIKALFEMKAAERGSVSQLRSMSDLVNSHLRALRSMATMDQIADGLLLQLFGSKIDSATRLKWEEDAPLSVLPSWNEFSSFLEKRCQTLENTEYGVLPAKKSSSSSEPFRQNRKGDSRKIAMTASKVETVCKLCKGVHDVAKCEEFIKLTPDDRYSEVKRLNLCINCLKVGHSAKNCRASRCRYCNFKHHTMLHKHQSDKNNANPNATAAVTDTPAPMNSVALTSQIESGSRNNNNQAEVLLATAIMDVRNKAGEFVPYRALLDSGSSLHFVSERLVQQLQLKKFKAYVDVIGIGSISTSVRYKTSLVIQSRTSDYKTNIEAFVLPKIANDHPPTRINSNVWNIPKNITLADPHFDTPRPIDLLIGANLFFELLAVGQICLGEGLPILQKTVLGWVVAGGKGSGSRNCMIATNKDEAPEENLEHLVRRFWELEEVRAATKITNEYQKHFQEHVRRDNTGRFVVRLPFCRDPEILGNSLDTAKKRFFALENRLLKNVELKEQYSKFILEYLQLGHMQSVEPASLPDKHFFLPHHAVLKPESSSTKLRVVFDASCKTTPGFSLNDVLMVGPVVQEELFSILLRFRSYKYALTADISKIYRQVRVDDLDTYWQCILWRNSSQEPLDIYRLLTVTYGTGPASFLATECLNQLAREEQERYPIGARILMRDFYVDDMLTGADSIEEAREIKSQIVPLLQLGNFTLTKWCLNSKELLSDFDHSDLEKYLSVAGDDVVKTLGMIWHPQTDSFRNHYQYSKTKFGTTKRTILSSISRLFDPLGLVNPVIVKAKILLQKLWNLKMAWDETIPQCLHTDWESLHGQLHLLSQIKIPRHIFSSSAKIEIHCFADASMEAYGACLYIRCVEEGSIACNLFSAKSRVAPLKTTSIPRLELCAALLAAELTARVHKIFAHKIEEVYCWSDSSIVLSWLSSQPSRWSVFVSNRIAKIQELSEGFAWKHVSSASNPADLVSRGVTPAELLESQIWFNGPSFLLLPMHLWPKTNARTEVELPEARKGAISLPIIVPDNLVNSSKFINDHVRLVSSFGYVYRFFENSKIRNKNSADRTYGPLTVSEFETALLSIIRLIQKEHLAEDYSLLLSGKPVKSNSLIKNLDPFIDNAGLIRVGGRLCNSDLDYDAKHPILLPKSNFTKALVMHYHIRNLHAGCQTLLAIIRTRFWPISGKTIVKQVVRSCMRCFRMRPKVMEQIMGQLPHSRVSPTPVFHRTGIDFCGPFYIQNPVRNRPAVKVYVCLFICLSVKAVHLEVASDLSTQAFIAVLRKFKARRPHVSIIYSDNATNFVGGARELKELKALFDSEEHCKLLQEMCLNDGIDWRFIPPRSPYFGGLWEAAVKQAKHHMRRVLGSESYSLDELQVITCQVEAILNSRPLTPLSEDVDDLRVLTPAHFLTGGPMSAIPEPNFGNMNIKLLTRWQYLQAKLHIFWSRWQSNYLQHLQMRVKWKTKQPNVKIGTLVLLKEDNISPLKWPLGRVEEVHVGRDGHVRVAIIRTMVGVVKRPIARLCPLPIEEGESQTCVGSNSSKAAGLC